MRFKNTDRRDRRLTKRLPPFWLILQRPELGVSSAIWFPTDCRKHPEKNGLTLADAGWYPDHVTLQKKITISTQWLIKSVLPDVGIVAHPSLAATALLLTTCLPSRPPDARTVAWQLAEGRYARNGLRGGERKLLRWR